MMNPHCPTCCRRLLLGLAITCLIPLPAAVGEDTPASSHTRAIDPQAFPAWQAEQRRRLREMLGIPAERVPLEAEKRGRIEWDGVAIEKWVFTSEPGSRVPAVLYRPAKPPARMPAVVLTFGHGGSKSQWQYDDVTLQSKLCTKLPNERMRELMSWGEYAALGAPHCALLVLNGDADTIIDRAGDGRAWTGTRAAVAGAARVYAALGAEGNIRAWFEPGGGHRPYFLYQEALEWIHRHLGTPAMTLGDIRDLPTCNSGAWCDRHGIALERLYGTPLHQRGATLPDLGLRPTPREKLSCLKPGELGSPEFTIEGWLEEIEKRPAGRAR